MARLGRKPKLRIPEAPTPVPQDPETPSLSEILVKQLRSFYLYSPLYLKIQTKLGELSPLEMNEVQLLLNKIIEETRAEGRKVRLVILKARRKGVSTWVSGRFFWKTTTTPNHYSMIVTHEPEATDFVFKMHKRFLQHLPDFLKPTERYNNKRVLEFNTDDGKGLDSAVRVGTAGKEDFGSGQLIHNLHISELAKYPKHTCTSLLLSLLQCVPPSKDSEIIMESTAKGVGGEFYDRYWSSRYQYEFYLDEDGEPAYRKTINETASEDNEYASVFIPWFVFKEYQMDVKNEMEFTDEEKELIVTHGVTPRQLAWRRWVLENQCDGDINLFNQEYPATAMDAFLSDSDNVFDVRKIAARMKDAPEPKVTYSYNFGTNNFYFDPKGKLLVWDEPKPGRDYVISCDPAEGIPGKDPTSIDVIDIATGSQVAHWGGYVHPDQCGTMLCYLGRRYNTGLLVVERNNHGIAVLDKILELGYTKLYAEMVVEPPARPRKRYGWVTTKTSKPRLVDILVEVFRQNEDGINHKGTLDEMMFFKQHEDMTFGAEEGHRDDKVMSYAMGKYVISKLPVSQKKQKLAQQFNRPYNTSKTAKRVTAASWT